jgi:ribosomal protein S18 acetylase RimI-like enzyme
MLEIRELTRQDHDKVACLLADALLSNTAFAYVLKDCSNRQESLVYFFRVRLAVVCDMGGLSLGMFENGECIATATLGPISSQVPSPQVLLRNGLIVWPFMIGFKSIYRALQIGESLTKASEMAHGKSDWEIMMVAVSTQRQGRGLGSQLIKAALDRIRQEQRGAKTVVGLTTQKARNVKFYQKVGFSVSGENDMFKDTSDSIHTWIMKLELITAVEDDEEFQLRLVELKNGGERLCRH